MKNGKIWFSIGGLKGVHISSIVNEAIRTISGLSFFLRKILQHKETQNKRKVTNKTKTSKY